MEDLPEYADLLGRGGETIAMAAAKYLYSMANFGEPWTTGVRDACLVLEKLDFSKEHQETDIREIINELNAILGDDTATYEYPGFIKLREFGATCGAAFSAATPSTPTLGRGCCVPYRADASSRQSAKPSKEQSALATLLALVATPHDFSPNRDLHIGFLWIF